MVMTIPLSRLGLIGKMSCHYLFEHNGAGNLGPSSTFGAKLFSRDTTKMADDMEVEVPSSTAPTSSNTSKDEAMEVELPQKEKATIKGSSSASSSSGKHAKGFELPW